MKNFVKNFWITALAALIVIACLASCGQGGTLIIQNTRNHEITGVFVIPDDDEIYVKIQNSGSSFLEHEGTVSIPAGESRAFSVRTDPPNYKSRGSPWFWVFVYNRWYRRVLVSHDETVTIKYE